MGTNSAAAVAMQMKPKFVFIRFGMTVGIGGGVPSAESDIRLGDVIISQPHMGQGVSLAALQAIYNRPGRAALWAYRPPVGRPGLF